jgi:hypothetical protein
MAKPDTNGAAARGEARRAIPLFYRRPQPISAEGFKSNSLARQPNFAFARGTNAVPLNAVEFGLASRHYPIAFSALANPFPQAIVGLRNAENLFVDAAGRWAERAYIPAYVRRYPFTFMAGLKKDELVLAADVASDLIVPDASNPFFKDGKPAKFIAQAGKFCTEFHKEHEKTRALSAALAEHGLLEPKRIEVTAPTGEKLSIGPLALVNTTKFQKLAEAVIVEWHRRGWLAAVHAHLLSLNNWTDLANRLAPR